MVKIALWTCVYIKRPYEENFNKRSRNASIYQVLAVRSTNLVFMEERKKTLLAFSTTIGHSKLVEEPYCVRMKPTSKRMCVMDNSCCTAHHPEQIKKKKFKEFTYFLWHCVFLYYIQPFHSYFTFIIIIKVIKRNLFQADHFKDLHV